MRSVLAALLILISGAQVKADSDVEHARYSVVASSGDIEIRDYAAQVVAETTVSGERSSAISEGFRRLAGYIFGANQPGEKIAMTAPVTIEKQTQAKLPVSSTQEELADGIWRIQFVMPSEYTLASLPKPKNNLVNIRQVPSRTYAVYVYSGLNGIEKVSKITQDLTAWIDQNHYEAIGTPQLARYNPPWTLPIFRRNEVLIEVKKVTK